MAVITSSVETLNPAKAREFLSATMLNRHVIPGIVQTYAAAMQDGRWLLSGEPIIISSNGELMNGQHRCQAVIKADVTIQALVVRGVEADAMKVMDTGRKRLLSDVLSMTGAKNGHSLASIVSCAWHYDNKPLHWLHYSLPNDVGLAVYMSDRIAFDEATTNARLCSYGIMTPKAAGFLLYETGMGAFEWLRRVAEGVHLEPDTGAYLLNRRIVAEATQVKQYLRFPVCAALMIKAYVADAKGKRLKNLRFGDDEGYPRLPTSLAPRSGRHIDAMQADKVKEPLKRPKQGPHRTPKQRAIEDSHGGTSWL